MKPHKMTVGEALVDLLEQAGVEIVFGIPGVHTIELYRGLARSKIRHITPRHEQGAAFMADGYARVSGKPGVCLLITGPGLSNAITAMAQARASSVPMLVITGVNSTATLGKGMGHLHELPDQAALAKTVAIWSRTLRQPHQLSRLLSQAFRAMSQGRPGPVHLEIPVDVMKAKISPQQFVASLKPAPGPSLPEVKRAAEKCRKSKLPLIVCGGGAVNCAASIMELAQRLGAPVVSTINARGIMAGHPLNLPASPSLACVRKLMRRADFVLAIGTELGPTDFDMFDKGDFVLPENLVRVDIDSAQLKRHPATSLPIKADAGKFLRALLLQLSDMPEKPSAKAAQRTKAALIAALNEIGPEYRFHFELLKRIWEVLPEAALVGDSTQPVYAGNLVVEAPRPGAWFNSSNGFGTLGYAAPAAIGASLANPARPIVCLTGDGGLQFTLAELGSASDCNANLAFVVWNNNGYGEIENAMLAANIKPVGVTPSAPDFVAVAKAFGLPALRVKTVSEMEAALQTLARPCLIEYEASTKSQRPQFSSR